MLDRFERSWGVWPCVVKRVSRDSVSSVPYALSLCPMPGGKVGVASTSRLVGVSEPTSGVQIVHTSLPLQLP